MASRLGARIARIAKHRQWQDALSLVPLLRKQVDEAQTPPGSEAFTLTLACTATATASLRCLSWQVALDVLQKDLQQNLWDQVAYCTALTACDRGLRWPLALQFLQQMETAALEVNDFVASAAINACGRSSAWIASLQLLEDFCTDHRGLERWADSTSTAQVAANCSGSINQRTYSQYVSYTG